MGHILGVTVGVEVGGKERFFNVPSVRNGRKLTKKEIFDSAAKKSKASRGFATEGEARGSIKRERAAVARKRRKLMEKTQQ